MHIRLATSADWVRIQSIYAEARTFMAEHGNGGQWGTTEPKEEQLLTDIAQNKLHICEEDGEIAAVFYFAVEKDPTYDEIWEGDWIQDGPYGVVHRVASARTVKGAASYCLNWAYEQTGNVRIDTHENNIPMQNMLKKNGFQYCGKIRLQNGDPRIAFQKI